ncbi:MAG: hypothetical protein WC838_05025 [Candidatus Margulisiibacteriota bacterium]
MQKPARYTGGELNSITKSWDENKLRIAIAFPDVYELGMSNLAIQILYGLLNEQADVLCERVFAPWPDMEEQLRLHKIPLFSLESRKPLGEFNAIGFSLNYELNYTNVLNMLDLAGIPLKSADRGPEHPLIFGGGHAAFNPEPLAEFIDFYVIGEAEEVMINIVETLQCNVSTAIDKQNILKSLSAIEGIYVPSIGNKYKRRIVADLDKPISL